MSDLRHNWMGNLTCRPLRIWAPHTLAELQEIVRLARAEKRRVRLFGSRHSWMPRVPTDDYLVDNTNLNRCLTVDREARTLTVECGMTLKQLTVRRARIERRRLRRGARRPRRRDRASAAVSSSRIRASRRSRCGSSAS